MDIVVPVKIALEGNVIGTAEMLCVEFAGFTVIKGIRNIVLDDGSAVKEVFILTKYIRFPGYTAGTDLCLDGQIQLNGNICHTIPIVDQWRRAKDDELITFLTDRRRR